jgi:mannose-6-phosphate isomerase-like protein (cupin superfamily)
MAHAEQIIENPVTGERFRWHLTSSDTDGRLARAEVWVRPGGGVFVEHLHPHSEERFEVLGGRLILEVDGESRVLVGGERTRFRAGVPHMWRNGGDEELHLFIEVHDPLGFEDMIEDAFGAARAGQTDARGRPKLLPGAVMLRSHAQSTRPTSPPARVQRLLVPPLALLARVLGRGPRAARAAGTAALVVTLMLAVAAPALADSIAYIKDGNVWLTSPDGSRQAQVTTSSDYSYVSQADDGTMIALGPNERLRKLSRTGKVLAEFPVYVSDGAPTSGPVNEFHGPFTPEISPDGRLVAFEWIDDNYSNGGSDCNETSVPPCYVFQAGRGVGITHSDRFTGYEEFGLITGWIFPHWVSNDTLLRSESGVSLNEDAVFTTVGPGRGDDGLKRWFWDDWGYGVSDVEISRDLKTVVGIAGQSGDEKLRVYRPLYDPFNAPAQDLTPFAENTPVIDPCFDLNDPAGGTPETPSLSPDGRGLAYSARDGIWVHSLPDISAGCQNGQPGRLLIPGGRHPDWGPADVPAAVVPGPGRGPRLRVKAARTSLSRALRRGLVLTVRSGGPGKARATALARGARVGAGRAAVGASGTAKVKVRFTRRAKRSLARRRSVRLTLKVGFRPEAGPAQTRRTVVRLSH